MRITIVDPTIETVAYEGKRAGNRIQKENPGCLFTVGYLLAQGHEAVFFRTSYESPEEACKKVLETNPELVIFGTYTYNYPFAAKVARCIKSKRLQVITAIGGYHTRSEFGIDSSLDYILIGDEMATAELVSSILIGKPIERTITKWVSREYLAQPVPPHREETLFDISNSPLFFNPPGNEATKLASISASRGCPARCSFCISWRQYGRTFLGRNTSHVVKEMSELQNRYKIDVFCFTDPTPNANPYWLKELCQTIIKHTQQTGQQFHWIAFCDLLIDEATLMLMKQAGCYWLLVGIEMADEEIRKEIGKRPSSLAMIEKIQNMGFLVRGYLMFGHPNLDASFYERQIEYLLCHPVGNIRINFMTPFPGTLLFEQQFQAMKQNSVFNEDVFMAGRDEEPRWELFTTENPVLKNNFFKQHELRAMREDFYDRYYLSRQYHAFVTSHIKTFPELEHPYHQALQLIEHSLL